MSEERARIVVTEKGLGYLKDLYKGSEAASEQLEASSLIKTKKQLTKRRIKNPLIDESFEGSSNLTNLLEDGKYIESILFPRIGEKYLTPFLRRKIDRIGAAVGRSGGSSVKRTSNTPSAYDTEGEMSIFSSRSKHLVLEKMNPKVQQTMSTKINYSENYLDKLIKKHEEVIERAKKTRELIMMKNKLDSEDTSKRELKIFSNGATHSSKKELDSQFHEISGRQTFYKQRHQGLIGELHRRKYKALWSQSQIPDYKRFADLKLAPV